MNDERIGFTVIQRFYQMPPLYEQYVSTDSSTFTVVYGT